MFVAKNNQATRNEFETIDSIQSIELNMEFKYYNVLFSVRFPMKWHFEMSNECESEWCQRHTTYTLWRVCASDTSFTPNFKHSIFGTKPIFWIGSELVSPWSIRNYMHWHCIWWLRNLVSNLLRHFVDDAMHTFAKVRCEKFHCNQHAACRSK